VRPCICSLGDHVREGLLISLLVMLGPELIYCVISLSW
jgi:hypothetical protein